MNYSEVKQPEELNVKNIFENSQYIIPIYQRNYAWEKGEIEQLLNDICDFSGNKHYLGNLIVDEIESNVFSVIDGQQRLTTLFLLLTYLQENTLSANSLRFEARDKSNRTLKELYDKKELKQDRVYSEEIISGYNIIENFFKTEKINKEEFKNKLKNILIIRVQVPKQINLNHYFEIMNTRGEQLELHEIAKGKILSIIDDEYKEVSALIWDNCSQMDSYIQMNFDKSNRAKIFGDNWDSFCLNSIEKIKNENKKSENEKFSLFNKLQNLVIEKDEKTDKKEENERFESIISFPNFLLIVNEALTLQNNSQDENDSSLDDKKFIKTLEKHWENSENAKNFIFNLLKYKFLFDKYIIKREFARDYKEEGKWSLQRLEKYKDEKGDKPNYKLTYNDEETKTGQLRMLQSALRVTYTSPKTMHWIAKTLTELGKNEHIDLIELLEKYACEKIEESKYESQSGFGFDRIVFTYLDYMLIRDKKVQNMSIENFQFQFRNSIEHFYPQNPTEKDKWNNENLNSFGNLALITVSGNSKFSNLDPQAKVTTYPSIIEQSPKLKLMSEENNWTQETTQKHGEKMLNLLKNEIQQKLTSQTLFRQPENDLGVI
ncbi:MAG: DUF262 domain-containing protein [Neisseriaceae bacterium]|nr:DUF262 domain-containing protein [Neisseriaceae bacterium]